MSGAVSARRCSLRALPRLHALPRLQALPRGRVLPLLMAMPLLLVMASPVAGAAAAAGTGAPPPMPGAGAPAAIPDFSGVWMPVGTPAALRPDDGRKLPLLPEGERLYADRQAARGAQRAALDGMARCLPPGVPRIYLQRMPFEVQQEPGAVNVLFQWNRQLRVVDLAAAHTGMEAGPAYEGHARGRFVGAELRVDTTGFNDSTWLDDSGLPHSTKLHTIERWWLDEGGQRLNIDFEIDDPVYYSGIWKFGLSFRRLPRATAIEEDVCVERQGLLRSPQSAPVAPAAPRPAPRVTGATPAPRTTPATPATRTTSETPAPRSTAAPAPRAAPPAPASGR